MSDKVQIVIRMHGGVELRPSPPMDPVEAEGVLGAIDHAKRDYETPLSLPWVIVDSGGMIESAVATPAKGADRDG